MARFRKVRPDFAWMAFSFSDAFTFDAATPLLGEYTQLIDFNDVSVDEVLLQDEKSDWFCRRVLLWYRLPFFPADGGLSNPTERLMHSRFGTGVREEIRPAVQALGSVQVITEWAHIIYDDCQVYGPTGPFNLDGDELMVTQGEGTTDDRRYPHLGPLIRADLHTNFSLRENTGFGVSWGSVADAAVDGEVHGINGMLKMLWQKRR